MNKRVIARLDIKGSNLVKGIHLEGLRVLGLPELFAKYYYESGADELMYIDVVASLYERNSLGDLISKTAKEIFIPLTVGGGIRTISDINAVLRAGADKVSINTAAVKNPNIIKEAAKKFGSSTIVVTIEAIKQQNGEYLAYIDNGREYTGVNVVDWAKKIEQLGAGEIVITSVDNEGTGKGFDIELTKQVSSVVSIPIIAHGGGGKLDHFTDVLTKGEADAIAVASYLHYNCVENKLFDLEVKNEGNIEFLKSNKLFNKVERGSISQIKNKLEASNIPCRKID